MVRDDNCETDVKSQREHYVEKQMINCNNKKETKVKDSLDRLFDIAAQDSIQVFVLHQYLTRNIHPNLM